MIHNTEIGLDVLCDLRTGNRKYPHGIYGRYGSTLQQLTEDGLVQTSDDDSSSWELTDAGKKIVDGMEKELNKQWFGDLSPTEKMVIIRNETFPEANRRRLMFDGNEKVAMCALSYLALTEKEFIRLGDSPSPTVRAEALRVGREHLRNGEDLDKKLSNYLNHTDEKTVRAILESLTETGNIGFVGEDLVERWFRSDIPDTDLLYMCRLKNIEVPSRTISELINKHDPAVFDYLGYRDLHRLDQKEIDVLLDEGHYWTHMDVAEHGNNLRKDQIRRLMDDRSDVREIIEKRLDSLSNALRTVEDNPALISRIRKTYETTD